MRLSFSFGFVCSSCVFFGVLGVVLVLSSTKVLLFFVGLELNTYSALLLVFFGSDQKSNKSCVQYLLVNALASTLLLWSVLFSSGLLFLLGLFLKLGFFPFIWWFPYLSESLKYLCLGYLNFMQKMIPFFLLFSIRFVSLEAMYFLILSTYVLSLMKLAYTQVSVKLSLVWSSTGNLCLMLLCSLMSPSSAMIFFFLYKVVVFALLFMLNKGNFFYWSELVVSSSYVVWMALICFFVFSGFPPFFGFYFKLLTFFPWVYANYFLFTYGGLMKAIFFFFLITFKSAIYMKMAVKLFLTKVSLYEGSIKVVLFLGLWLLGVKGFFLLM